MLKVINNMIKKKRKKCDSYHKFENHVRMDSMGW